MTAQTDRLEAALPPLLTTRQAAALAGCGERTYWGWARAGLAPGPIKIGNGAKASVRYQRDAILDWIAAGCPPNDQAASTEG